VTGRRGRRRRKQLDDLKERRGHSHLKEEALDRTTWTARFGRGFWPVVRQTTQLGGANPSMAAEFQADGRTDMTNLIFTFRYFANAFKNEVELGVQRIFTYRSRRHFNTFSRFRLPYTNVGSTIDVSGKGQGKLILSLWRYNSTNSKAGAWISRGNFMSRLFYPR
jgi:hypothetical protein